MGERFRQGWAQYMTITVIRWAERVFSHDSGGFENGTRMTLDLGRESFAVQWGRGGYNIHEAGLTEDDAWRVEADWEQ